LDELVARINAGRGKEARGGLQADGLGVFLSFIAAIFIDDILRSLHHLCASILVRWWGNVSVHP
jgi:hypothetical protein